MDKKTRQNLLHDITAVFGNTVRRIVAKDNYVDVEIKEGMSVTMLEFPHLLTIAKGYNVTVEVYPMETDNLGVYFKEMK